MGLNIKAAIARSGITQKELAKRLGISEVGLSQHVNGKPGIATLERISDALGIDVVELFDAPPGGHYTCPHCGKALKIEKAD